MAKKETKEKEVEVEAIAPTAYGCPEILPITDTFGNADLNTLRDKINEVIKAL